ncbi:MAG: VWA domain-containing protein [Bryobacteraceae bacterium]
MLVATLGAQQGDVVFKSSSNLVILDVTVRDRSGKEIPNLEKRDFTLLEDGKPQTISVFEFQRLSSEPAAAIAAKVAPARQQTITTSTPGTVRYQDRRLMVLFFDFSSMPPADQIRARESGLKFLASRMHASDLVSIMTFSQRLRVEQDFTDDRDRLTEVIKGFRIGEASELAIEGGNGDDNTGEDNGAAFSADETEFNIFNTDRKLSALESAAKMLAALPEKKALVYFSSGVGKTGVENQSQLRSTINAAVRANVAFYPIDARGLVALPPGGDATAAAPKGNSAFTGAAQTRQKDRFNDQQETLVSLAADTGGKAFLDNNDLSLGIQQARDDVRSYYILGYYSTNAAPDGRFRRIKLALNNQTQAKLDYRGGYFGRKIFAKYNAADKESQLEEALMLGDPVTDLPLAIETDYFRITKSTYFVPVSVKIPGSGLALTKKGSNQQTEFDFIGQVRDSKGKLAASVRDGIKVKMSDSSAAQLNSRALQYDTGFTLPPGQYQLKFLARENQTGKMGTFESKFAVPDLNLPGPSLRISSVIWSGQRQALNAAVGAADTKKKSLAADPLIQDGQKLVPSITRVFRKDQNLYVYLEVYDPSADPAEKKPSVSATLAFYRGKAKAFESAPVRLTQLAGSRSNALPVQFQVPLAKLSPGKYTCQVNVIDEQAKRFAFPRADLVLLP